MGLATIIRKKKFKEREVRILILGLDNAGKSTCVAKWLGHSTDAINDSEFEKTPAIAPTFGFEIKTIYRQGLTIIIWDVGGQSCLRPFWRNFFEDASDALVYVIDSQDVHRFEEAVTTMLEQLKCAKSLTLTIVANKQDLPGSMPPEEIQSYLESIAKLHFPRHIHWKLYWGSALSAPEGIMEAFDWTLSQVANKFDGIPL